MNCDNCEIIIINYNFYPITCLKYDIYNANKNESAILCKKCFEDLK